MTTLNFDMIEEGATQTLSKKIEPQDVQRFVELTGDNNPLHVDPDYASKTPFKEPVVHGMLGASFVSTVIGTRLPGPGALWVSQSFSFTLPVRVGDTLTITCKVRRKHLRDRLLELDTEVVNQHGQQVMSGSGKVHVLPEASTPPQQTASPLKVALVTGGSGAIGSAICRALAAAGLHVGIHYHHGRQRALALADELNHSGSRAFPVAADLGTQEGPRNLCQDVRAALGPVGVVVHAASPRIVAKPIAELSWEYTQQQLEIQLKSALELVQSALPDMSEQRSGRIVFIASQAADSTPVPGWTAYALAKGGLQTLTRYLAAELAPQGITSNAVSPGLTDTGFVSALSAKQQLMLARQNPTRRLGLPTDVANAVAFLTSPAASYINGQSLRVNGGGSMSW